VSHVVCLLALNCCRKGSKELFGNFIKLLLVTCYSPTFTQLFYISSVFFDNSVTLILKVTATATLLQHKIYFTKDEDDESSPDTYFCIYRMDGDILPDKHFGESSR
jgi:hypothetical protein